MTAKEYLLQVLNLEKKIRRLEWQRADLRAQMYRVGSPANLSERVQTSKTDDTFLRLIARVDRKERQIVKEIDRLIILKDRVIRQIGQLDDERQREVLYERYINLKDGRLQSWEGVAEQLHYTDRQCKRIHGRALQQLQSLL